MSPSRTLRKPPGVPEIAYYAVAIQSPKPSDVGFRGRRGRENAGGPISIVIRLILPVDSTWISYKGQLRGWFISPKPIDIGVWNAVDTRSATFHRVSPRTMRARTCLFIGPLSGRNPSLERCKSVAHNRLTNLAMRHASPKGKDTGYTGPWAMQTAITRLIEAIGIPDNRHAVLMLRAAPLRHQHRGMGLRNVAAAGQGPIEASRAPTNQTKSKRKKPGQASGSGPVFHERRAFGRTRGPAYLEVLRPKHSTNGGG
jgi:hypothetical protein